MQWGERRKPERKRRAVIDLRNELDLAAMGFGDLTNNRQTQSAATLLAAFT